MEYLAHKISKNTTKQKVWAITDAPMPINVTLQIVNNYSKFFHNLSSTLTLLYRQL